MGLLSASITLTHAPFTLTHAMAATFAAVLAPGKRRLIQCRICCGRVASTSAVWQAATTARLPSAWPLIVITDAVAGTHLTLTQSMTTGRRRLAMGQEPSEAPLPADWAAGRSDAAAAAARRSDAAGGCGAARAPLLRVVLRLLRLRIRDCCCCCCRHSPGCSTPYLHRLILDLPSPLILAAVRMRPGCCSMYARAALLRPTR